MCCCTFNLWVDAYCRRYRDLHQQLHQQWCHVQLYIQRVQLHEEFQVRVHLSRLLLVLGNKSCVCPHHHYHHHHHFLFDHDMNASFSADIRVHHCSGAAHYSAELLDVVFHER